MFTLQNWKIKLVYIGFGSFFGCLCTIIGMLASPVSAQRDTFGVIECTELWVVDEEGRTMALLGSHEHGGRISVLDRNGKIKAWLSVDEHGGRVHAHGKGKGGSVLAGDEYGGTVGVHDKDGKSRGLFGIDDRSGGFIQFNGKSEGKVAIGINEHGNGAVSTWDKNGYRQ